MAELPDFPAHPLQIFSTLLNGLLISFVPVAHLLAGHPQRDQTLMFLLVAIYGVFFLAIVSFVQTRHQAQDVTQAGNPILVDGSNVMHWGGDPSLPVLVGVLRDLQSHGYTPLVYFDANVGYKLHDRHANSGAMAQHLGLARWQVEVVPGGIIADERLLERASRGGMQIVTNDRFQDWRTRFPRIGEHGFLIKGRWTGRDVVWRFPQDLSLLAAA